MKKINILLFLLIISCSTMNSKEYKNYKTHFSHINRKEYLCYLREERKENRFMSKNEFLKFRAEGYTLENFRNYRDFCLKNSAHFFCSKEYNKGYYISVYTYLENKNFFDKLSDKKFRFKDLQQYDKI